MSDGSENPPHHFAMIELHRLFNENFGPYTWMSYHDEADGLVQDLKKNSDFEMLRLLVDADNQSSCIFVSYKTKAMVLICQNSIDHAELEVYGHKGIAQVAITASTFLAMEEVVALVMDPMKNIENLLRDVGNE